MPIVLNIFSFPYITLNQWQRGKWILNVERPRTAVVGENGVGKTRLLISFIIDLLTEALASSKRPIFSSIIAMSSTHLDNYWRIQSTNWKLPYCALVVEHDKTIAIDSAIASIGNIIKRGMVKGTSLLRIYAKFVNSLIRAGLDELMIVHLTEEEGRAGKQPYVNRNGVVAV